MLLDPFQPPAEFDSIFGEQVKARNTQRIDPAFGEKGVSMSVFVDAFGVLFAVPFNA